MPFPREGKFTSSHVLPQKRLWGVLAVTGISQLFPELPILGVLDLLGLV